MPSVVFNARQILFFASLIPAVEHVVSQTVQYYSRMVVVVGDMAVSRWPGVEPCPVDCIDMIPLESTLGEWKWNLPPRSEVQALDIIASDRNVPSEASA